MGKKDSVDTVIAKRWEREAQDEENPSEKSKKYKLSGDAWRRGKEFGIAIRAYNLAKKYARGNEEYIKMLDEKIRSTDSQQQKRKGKEGWLERHLRFAILSIVTLAIALFFTSFSFTGYAVGGLTSGNFRWMGVILFVLGLVFAFSYFKYKK